MRDSEARPRKRRRPPTRRKTVRWSPHEVDALLAGVRVHGVGKWAAILRHSKVFNGVRTSVDLKDKWRNLTSPVRAAALAQPDPDQHLPTQHHDENEQSQLPHHSPAPDPDDILPTDGSPVRSCSPDDIARPIDMPTETDDPDDASLPQSEQHPSLSILHPNLSCHSAASKSQTHSISDSPALRHSQSHSHSNTPSHTPTLTPKPLFSTNQDSLFERRHLSAYPPPPSESSVSPEVLSTPSTAPIGQTFHKSVPLVSTSSTALASAPPITPTSAPVQTTSQSFPLQPDYGQVPNPQNQGHLHTPAQPHQPNPNSNVPGHDTGNPVMQQAYAQSWYHSAAAVAAYFRRLGQEPTPYQIAAVLTATTPPGMLNSYCAANSTLYQSGKVDDDEDEDDDDDLPQITTSYGIPFPHLMGKNGMQSSFHNPAWVPGYQTHSQPLPTNMAPQVPFPTSNPNATSQKNAKPEAQNGKISRHAVSESKAMSAGPASVAAATSSAMDIDSGNTGSGCPLTSEAAAKPSQTVKGEPALRNATPVAPSAKIENKVATHGATGNCSGTRCLGNGEIPTGPASGELELFSVADFPEKGRKVPNEGDDESSDAENLVGNAWGMAPRIFGGQANEEARSFSATDLV